MRRRGFLTAAAGAIGGAIAAGLGLLGGAIVKASARWPVRRAKKWAALCRLADVKDEPLATQFTFQRLEGWYVESVTRQVYVAKDERGAPVVFSRRCTHLGCPVSWKSQERRFRCHCHGAVFDDRGGIVQGPQFRPLDRLECRIAGEMVEVAEA